MLEILDNITSLHLFISLPAMVKSFGQSCLLNLCSGFSTPVFIVGGCDATRRLVVLLLSEHGSEWSYIY